MLKIRPFAPRDAQGVASLTLPVQQEEFAIPIALEAQPDLQDIPAFYQRLQANRVNAMQRHGEADRSLCHAWGDVSSHAEPHNLTPMPISVAPAARSMLVFSRE